MSMVEEEVVVAPWVGPTSCKNTLSVIVLSFNNDIIEKLSKALTEVHDKGDYLWKLIVLKSFYLEEVVKRSDLTGKIGIDFVILAIDTSRLFCLKWARNALLQVNSDLKIRRVVLVNASGLPVNAMAISASELINFQNEMKLDILTANVFDSENATCLARRLLKYIEVSIGVKTGIPNLNV
ncbi:unnamed protein product [Spodoptera littoralis]|uniref:Centromere protein M n=1 Tax=Spodoptera littoralis TaxID=7109 RepID=A0A9P0HZL7_SPOLI|nr:unnamed protein product [Spodoptera littoralis]CAH1636775.1 unnamed protein product [Spodoptera littoralis]